MFNSIHHALGSYFVLPFVACVWDYWSVPPLSLLWGSWGCPLRPWSIGKEVNQRLDNTSHWSTYHTLVSHWTRLHWCLTINYKHLLSTTFQTQYCHSPQSGIPNPPQEIQTSCCIFQCSDSRVLGRWQGWACWWKGWWWGGGPAIPISLLRSL